MKVCVIYLGRKGGGASYSFQMCRALLEKGVEIKCILADTIENKKAWKSLCSSPNFSVEFLPTYNSKFSFLKSFFPSKKYKECVKNIKKWDPAFIYIPMITLNARKLIQYFPPEKIITTIHDLEPHPGERNPIQRIIFERIKRRSSRFIVLTESFVKPVAEKYGVSQNNVSHIPHAGFDFNPEGFVVDTERIHNNILFFGRITPYKGLNILLQAFDSIKNILPKITLTIAGEGFISPEEMEIIKKNSDRIKLHNDWLSEAEIGRLFASCDFTVLPYTEASQSGVAAASFGSGRTIIASDIGGLKEQVTPANGVMVKAGSVEALSKAIQQLYADTDKIKKRNKEAYEFYKKFLTWEASATNFLKFIEPTKK